MRKSRRKLHRKSGRKPVQYIHTRFSKKYSKSGRGNKRRKSRLSRRENGRKTRKRLHSNEVARGTPPGKAVDYDDFLLEEKGDSFSAPPTPASMHHTYLDMVKERINLENERKGMGLFTLSDTKKRADAELESAFAREDAAWKKYLKIKADWEDRMKPRR